MISHGWHTGLVVPSNIAFKIAPELQTRFADSNYIEFGWGDSGFYQADQISLFMILKAMLIPSETVVHTVGIKGDPVRYFSNSESKLLLLSDQELSHLVTFITRSFAKSNQSLINLRPGIYGDSQFYKATGSYYLLNTCNSWTAKGLNSIGMDLYPAFNLTSESIMSEVRSDLYFQ